MSGVIDKVTSAARVGGEGCCVWSGERGLCRVLLGEIRLKGG